MGNIGNIITGSVYEVALYITQGHYVATFQACFVFGYLS